LPPERVLPALLIVDDEPHNLVALEAALASLEDCSVVQAHSGRDALKCLLIQDFAVIVLDVHMPGMDGFETRWKSSARSCSTS
jgi:CheY-like chemotaxis protein